MSFDGDTPEQHSIDSPAPQLVTVVITIHDEALQQALHQAQTNLQLTQTQAAQLQTQADALRTELQQAAVVSTSASTADSTSHSHDVHDLQAQLQAALQQAGAAAAQHAAAVAATTDLRRQLTQQGSSLAEEQRVNGTLRTELQAAEATVAETSGTVQLLRYAATMLCMPSAMTIPAHALAYCNKSHSLFYICAGCTTTKPKRAIYLRCNVWFVREHHLRCCFASKPPSAHHGASAVLPMGQQVSSCVNSAGCFL